MDTHLHHHPELPLESSALRRDVVIGMSDGLTVPFALAAGLSAALDSTAIIVIAGLTTIAAGSITMALGGYLAAKTALDHYNAELKREADVAELIPAEEKNEVKAFFANLGLSEEVQRQAMEQMTTDKQKWVDFMMKYELGLNKPDPGRAKKSAFNIGIAYVVGGMIPLSPYFFTADPMTGLRYSAAITLVCLFLFGYIRSKITSVSPIAGAIRATALGAVAAACAFGIAKLITGA